MTTREMREAREQLERSVSASIVVFEERTGLMVRSFEILRALGVRDPGIVVEVILP